MSAISTSHSRMDAKLAEFREEIRQSQEDAAAKALKRARFDKPYVFKKRGNEEQASFNSKVDEALAQAESDLASVAAGPALAPAVQRVKDGIRRGRSLIDERQKLIRLADRSEHGWGVVDEYTADDLAEDSEDEKRIEKAERAAERKAGKRRKKRNLQTGYAKPRGGTSRAPTSVNQSQLAGMPVVSAPLGQSRRPSVTPAARPIGPCHFCGEFGHLRLYCPARAAAAQKQWYPFQVECVTGVDVEDKESMCESAECAVGVNKETAESNSVSNTVRESVDCVCAKSDETVGCVPRGQAAVAPSVSTEIGQEEDMSS